MIRVSNIKIGLDEGEERIKKKIAKLLRITEADILELNIIKESIDARKKHQIFFLYNVDVKVKNEKEILKLNKDNSVKESISEFYETPESGQEKLDNSPIIIGTGPAGLMAGYMLAKMGYKPILLERGECVEKREESVNNFWKNGKLSTESNIQFGEGGAGTFSDGKLNSGIKDLRCREVMEIFIEHGAPEEIIYSSKPHIGTDILKTVVKNLRNSIIEMGGEVRFNTVVTDFKITGGKITGVEVNHREIISSQIVVLAIGHSARDTFEMMYNKGIDMIQKPFAVGVRIEHPQDFINEIQYGEMKDHTRLKSSDYKLAYHGENGESAHTFCMCPGGQVVGAASEENTVVTNGMSYYARDLENANSAILVPVGEKIFKSTHVLAGVEFQRKIEKAAFVAGGSNYCAPAQLVDDLLNNRASKQIGSVKPSYLPGVKMTHLGECMPAEIVETIKNAIIGFDKKMNGFAMKDAVLTGIESRSSSPVRILRDQESLESTSTKGLYPAGEGAGYAGGIMSAGVDGIKIADKIIEKYCEF